MKRMGWATGSLTVIALLLTACGDSDNSTLSEDDFIDELNSVCDEAGRDIRRLDIADRNFFDEVLDIMQTGSEDLKELKPPSDLEDDFNDFVDNLDDQIQETENLRDAVDDDDSDAATDASDELTDLAADANDLADSLGADDCVDIGVDASTTDTTDPDVSTPNTPLPIETTIPSTAPPPTDPPITDPPPTTAPVTTPPTMPEMTIPAGTGGGEGLALDASLSWAPPAGFEWGVLDDLASASTPYDNPVIAPTLVGYWAGIIQNPSTNQAALVYFSESSADWTAEQLDALFDFELSGGTDATTPAGIPARIALGVGSEAQFDAGLIYTNRNTLTVYALAGSLDLLTTLDAIVTANTMGG